MAEFTHVRCTRELTKTALLVHCVASVYWICSTTANYLFSHFAFEDISDKIQCSTISFRLPVFWLNISSWCYSTRISEKCGVKVVAWPEASTFSLARNNDWFDCSEKSVHNGLKAESNLIPFGLLEESRKKMEIEGSISYIYVDASNPLEFCIQNR